jgi:hypothetical protein
MDDISLHKTRTGRHSAFESMSQSISDRKQTDPFASVTVVVPSQYAGVVLRRALAVDHGLLNIRFMILTLSGSKKFVTNS